MHHFGLKISVGVIVFCFFFFPLYVILPTNVRYEGIKSQSAHLQDLQLALVGRRNVQENSLLNCLSHESLANYSCRLYLAREVPIILLSNKKEILIRLSCHYPFSSANSHSCITEYINQQISESQPKRRCETLQQLELSLHVKSSL